MLDASFDDAKRRAILAELHTLAQSGMIRLERNGRWKPASAPWPTETQTKTVSAPITTGADGDILFAVPGRITQEPMAEEAEAIENGTGLRVDPHALLRYWRSALRSDPRGAISQAADRHGLQWVLATGSGKLKPEEGARCVLTFELDSLPADFRQALLRGEANEMTLAVGWPIMVGRKSGVPVIWPVGLLAAEWSRADHTLRVSIEADDVLVNPDWLDGAARTAGWQKSEGFRPVRHSTPHSAFRPKRSTTC